jgi:hypothetical protein
MTNKTKNSFRAVIELKTEGFMLGGTRKYISSAFALESDAQAFADQSVEVNRNRWGCAEAIFDVRIVPVYSRNPIQAVNS